MIYCEIIAGKKIEVNKRRNKKGKQEKETEREQNRTKNNNEEKKKRRILSSCDLRVVNVVCIMRFCECGCVN